MAAAWNSRGEWERSAGESGTTGEDVQDVEERDEPDGFPIVGPGADERTPRGGGIVLVARTAAEVAPSAVDGVHPELRAQERREIQETGPRSLKTRGAT